MIIPSETLKRMESDLGLNRPYVKGQVIEVKNCWHFCTEGERIDMMFIGKADFVHGMNSVYIVLRKYNVIIIAFVLMDTHVHFVLYGDFDECNGFMRDYIRRLSRHFSLMHKEKHKFDDLPVSYQPVDTDTYLKTVICYVVKNPTEGGIPFMGWNYPWSSGPLYFVPEHSWTAPSWVTLSAKELTGRYQKALLNTRSANKTSLRVMDDMIFPGEYVAVEIVQRIFKTCKSYNYFMCRTREDDVDSRGGTISNLSIPIQELRQCRNEMCMEMFGRTAMNSLKTQQRIALARAMRRKYNSSPKQIAKACGLVFDEVKDLI